MAVEKVRRNKAASGWCISDEANRHFKDSFFEATMKNVTFVHRAFSMTCVAGYDSTGEAIGNLVRREKSPVVPKGVAKKNIVYSSSKRRFHVEGKPQEMVDSADYLLLFNDGKAIACWKK